jgi:superfamily II RNA helicase
MVKVCAQKYDSENKQMYNVHFDAFPFPLSAFQKYAIEAIIEGHHTLVTAHTGSGKTLPAEFAIRYFTDKRKKVIYTSPIKALSNQKYYEFSQKFPDISIGLFTGDIKTNPEADVLIMTTEILMNTLFNHVHNMKTETATQMTFQMDFANELAAVVFDEVHYINDESRGQVWEKCLMMLPEHVQKIMLSATIDNAKGFAEWCEKIHPDSKRIVYLSTTNTRVVPLTHYGYMIAGEGNLKTVKNKAIQQELRQNTNKFVVLQNERGLFDPSGHGYANLVAVQKHLRDFRFVLKRKFVLNHLVSQLHEKAMLPAIAFVFSRKHVELCAREITVQLLEDDSKIPYTVQRECEQIVRRLPNGQEYLRLPEYIEVVRLLEKGIGIHHSGMIPILREIVEICISKKYVKVLFATESFAIGLDCPIKTVIFTSLTKFDGNVERLLEPHEYTQMAGRAGRRGIDTVGHVIHCNNLFTIPDRGSYLTILRGRPPELVSKFKVSYDLVLNVIKTVNESKKEIAVQEYVNKSMMALACQEKRKEYMIQLEKDKSQLREWTRTTPENICEEYDGLVCMEMKVVNKKRKEVRKKINAIELEYDKSLQMDLAYWKNRKRLYSEVENNEAFIAHLDSNIAVTVERVCKILETEKYIESIDDDSEKNCNEASGFGWRLTELGTFASHISEINPLLWSYCMVVEWKYLGDFTVRQMIGLLSCTTDIKVSPDIKSDVPKTEDVFLKTRILEMINIDVDFQKKELEQMGQERVSTSNEYELMYDMIDEAMEWCDCDTEELCKEFIELKLAAKGVSTGDFAKAMLKIATISREMSSLSTLDICKNQIEWFHKWSQVEGMVLKYIVTNQSLYV